MIAFAVQSKRPAPHLASGAAGRSRRRWFGAACALALSCGGAFAAGAPPHAVLLFTGGVKGCLEDPGLARAPGGGIDRRAGFVNQLRRRWPTTAVGVLDAGDFADAPGPAGELRTRAIVHSMNFMGYAAAGVGERELALGAELFQQIAEAAQFPFVATNLVRARDGAPWLSPNAVVRLGGIKFAVFSVVRHNPAMRLPLPDGDAVETIDPVLALQRYVGRDATQMTVLLTDLPVEDARFLARRVPGIDLILGAHGGRITPGPIAEGTTFIVYAGGEGRYVGQVEVHRSGPSSIPDIGARVASLSADVPAEPTVTSFVAEVLARARELERRGRGRPEGPRTFLGPSACLPCHEPIVKEWRGTEHAKAYQTLARRGSFSPRCAACHVTGWGQAGGFADPGASPHLLDVSCEACHGPAADHVRQPARPYGKISIANCTSCHTPEMDAGFNYYEDVQLVRHSQTR